MSQNELTTFVLQYFILPCMIASCNSCCQYSHNNWFWKNAYFGYGRIAAYHRLFLGQNSDISISILASLLTTIPLNNQMPPLYRQFLFEMIDNIPSPTLFPENVFHHVLSFLQTDNILWVLDLYLAMVQKCSNNSVPIPRGPKISDILESYKEFHHLKNLWLPIFGNIRIKWLLQLRSMVDVPLIFNQILSSFHWNMEEKYLKNMMEFIQQNHSCLNISWNHVFLCAKHLSMTSCQEHWKCFRKIMDFHSPLEPLLFPCENIQQIIQVMVYVCEQMSIQTIQNHEMFSCSVIFLNNLCFQTSRENGHAPFQIHLSQNALAFIRDYECQDVEYSGKQLVLRIQQLFSV